MRTVNNKTGLILLLVAALQLIGCQKKSSNYEHIEPAHLEHIEGSELSKLALTEKAAERLMIQTAPVAEEIIVHSPAELRAIIPYSALIYDAQAHVWVYTNPEPLTFIRHEVVVDFIEGDKAILLEGPPAGTKVVTVGAAELFGAEYKVGH